MRMKSIIILSVILSVATSATAQNIAPPPGFAPGGGDTLSGDNSYVAPSPLPSDSSRDYGILSQTVPPDSNSNIFGMRGARGAYAYPPAGGLVGVDSSMPPLIYMPFPNVWFGAEALIWWTKANPVPVPLVTEGQALGTGPVVLGNQPLSMPTSTGGRFTLGFGFGMQHEWAFEGAYFFLNNGGSSQGVSSDGSSGSAPLSFPFYDPTLPGESSSPIALPGQYAGTAVVTAQTFLQGLDANIMHNLVHNGDNFRFDLLGGLRWVNLQESLSFNTSSPNVFPNSPDFFNTFDAFNTQNNFYGGQVGGRVSLDNGRFFCNATGKMALGATVETVGINGGTFTNYQGSFVSAQGAYLTQPSNIGSQTATRFAVIPELNMNVGMYLTPWMRLTLGYSFMFISSVARPGDQIDRVINPSQSYAITGNNPANLSGPARPAPSVQSSDFWAQGINIGLDVRY